MLNDEIKTWLADIKQAVTEIKSFLPEKKNFFEFQKDIKTKRAIVIKDIPMLEKEISALLQ